MFCRLFIHFHSDDLTKARAGLAPATGLTLSRDAFFAYFVPLETVVRGKLGT